MFTQFGTTDEAALINSVFGGQLSAGNSPLKKSTFNQMSVHIPQSDDVCEMLRKITVEDKRTDNVYDYSPQEEFFSNMSYSTCFNSPYTDDNSLTNHGQDLSSTIKCGKCDKLETASF